MLSARRVAVSAERIVVRSALRILLYVSLCEPKGNWRAYART